MKQNQDFSIQNKTDIYFNQYYNNFKNIQNINVKFLGYHIDSIKLITKLNNLIVCPYCINCLIFPGKHIAQELLKKYNLRIDETVNLFDKSFIRPGECDFIIPIKHGGSYDITNGIYICSQCQKQKGEMSIQNFFENMFEFNQNRYFKKYPQKYISLMDVDNFKNRCLNCNHHNPYKICTYCAGKKDEIIYIAD